MAGKGSAPRPMPDRGTFETNFDNIFRKSKPKDESSASPRQGKGEKDDKAKDNKV